MAGCMDVELKLDGESASTWTFDWVGFRSLGWRALDAIFRAICNLLYTLRARFVCGGEYVRMVAVPNGPARLGCPGPFQANIAIMRGPAGERYRVITRGLTAPEWSDVEDDVIDHEDKIMFAELLMHRQSGARVVVDITPLVYHLPSHLMVTPIGICALVLGERDATSGGECQVTISLLDRVVTIQSHEIVTSEVAA